VYELSRTTKIFLKERSRQDILVISSHGRQVEGQAGWKPTQQWKPKFYTERGYGGTTQGNIPQWVSRYSNDALSGFDTSQNGAGSTPGDYWLSKFQTSHKGRLEGRGNESYNQIMNWVDHSADPAYDILTIRARVFGPAEVKLSDIYSWLNRGSVGDRDLHYPVIIGAFCLVPHNYGAYVPLPGFH
jgi:hypothetical protein